MLIPATGGKKTKADNTAKGKTAIAKKDLLLPSFKPHLSDKPAISGSVIPSNNRPVAKTRPIIVRPKTTTPFHLSIGTTYP